MIQQKNSPKCIILRGIPCSGKSTWAAKQGLPIVSCDEIRELLKINGKYYFTRDNEDLVWKTFYTTLSGMKTSFIVDNTNCKNSYVIKIINDLNSEYIWEIEEKWFPIPLWKAYYRNIIRYIKTGKFIPFQIIKQFKMNYDYQRKYN